MSTGAAPKEPLPFTPDQKQIVANLATITQTVASLLVLVGVLHLAAGPIWVIKFGGSVVGGLLMVVAGVLFAILGLVLLAASSDFKCLGQFPQFGGNHLRNVAKNMTVFYQLHIGLAVVIALMVLLRAST